MKYDIVHTGRRIQVALHESKLEDGTIIRRDVVLHPGAVAILPVFEDGSICLLRNHRFIFETELWEIPAGTREPGEEPAVTAHRELAEETGYTCKELEKIAEFIPSPGVMSEVIHVYIARGLKEGAMRPEADEQLEPVRVPFEKALEWVIDGTIRDAKTMTAILLEDRKRRLAAKH